MGLVFKEDNDKSLVQNRQSIVVWLIKSNDQYKLRHYGNIIFFSRKRLYAILYVDKDFVEKISEELNQKDFVKKVEYSKNSDLIFSEEHEEKTMSELNKQAEILHEKKEDFKV